MKTFGKALVTVLTFLLLCVGVGAVGFWLSLIMPLALAGILAFLFGLTSGLMWAYCITVWWAE